MKKKVIKYGTLILLIFLALNLYFPIGTDRVKAAQEGESQKEENSDEDGVEEENLDEDGVEEENLDEDAVEEENQEEENQEEENPEDDAWGELGSGAVISGNGSYQLSAETWYQLGTGTWKVNDDPSSYSGGIEFYVSISGEYSFTN